jgi:hypothetical protein
MRRGFETGIANKRHFYDIRVLFDNISIAGPGADDEAFAFKDSGVPLR